VCAGADALGVAEYDVRAGGHLVEQQHHLVDEQWRQRLHALDSDAVGELVEHLDQAGMLDGQLLGSRTHLVGQQ
jgi:hypothetical protein